MAFLRDSTSSALLLTLLVVGGCRDGIRPELVGARLQIYSEGVLYDEQTILHAATLQLTGNVLDARGEILEGETVEWRSDNPEVASADVEVGKTVVVSAKGPGTTRIIARHAVGEDTAIVNVAAGLSQNELPTCDGRPAQNLAKGEVAVFTGAELLPLCLPGGVAEQGEYTLALINAGETAASQLRVLVQGTQVVTPSPGPNPELRPMLRLNPQERFHSRLREEVNQRLEPLLTSGAGSLRAPTIAPQAAVGQTLSFNTETTSEDGCTHPSLRSGQVRYISQRAIVVADVGNPAGGYTDADYKSFGEFFDSQVWPLVTENFGEPSDSDGNGKVFIFFTRAVNDLAGNSPVNSGSVIGGFFFNRDLFAKSSCAGSNAAEMFYMLVPNPEPASGERRFAKADVERSTRSVLVHEFQHLVNDSRRLHVTKAPVWEETWLNEGLSHIAEELMFYRDSGLAPRSNLRRDAFANLADRESFRQFQLDNLERLALFLQNPEYFSLIGNDVLATRGATWSFLRYAADRRGGNEKDLWGKLVRDVKSSGLTNLREALRVSPLEWISHWGVALYLDDAGVNTDSRYTLASWNFRDLYPAASSLWLSTHHQRYPLRVQSVTAGSPTAFPLQGSGVGYQKLAVAPGKTSAVHVAIASPGSPLLPLPSRVKVAVIRTR